jgi:hypothetical protein
MLGTLTSDGIHLSTNGAMQDAYDFVDKFSWMFPKSAYTTLSSKTDGYNSTYNPNGDLVGLMPLSATAGLITLTASFQTIGPFQVKTFGAGSSTATAQISARTDTFPDGSVVPGNELVITFSAGTGSVTAVVVYGTFASGISLAGPGQGGTTYTAGTKLFGTAEYGIDLASLSGVPTAPNCYLTESAPAVGQSATMFTDANTVTSLRASAGIITTPILTTQTGSYNMTWVCQLGVTGTVSTTPTFRIRNMGIMPNTGLYPRVF